MRGYYAVQLLSMYRIVTIVLETWKTHIVGELWTSVADIDRDCGENRSGTLRKRRYTMNEISFQRFRQELRSKTIRCPLTTTVISVDACCSYEKTNY